MGVGLKRATPAANLSIRPLSRIELAPGTKNPIMPGLSFSLFTLVQPMIPSKYWVRDSTAALGIDGIWSYIRELIAPQRTLHCRCLKARETSWNPVEPQGGVEQQFPSLTWVFWSLSKRNEPNPSQSDGGAQTQLRQANPKDNSMVDGTESP